MGRLFHVSSAANRDSILAHGLDWTRMGAAPGIAGSTAPEAPGVFLCADEFEARFFAEMNNTGGPVDVWAVIRIDERLLVESGNGFSYYPAKIPPSQVAFIGRTAADGAPRSAREEAVSMSEGTQAAVALFEDAITWLREHYDKFEFWTERDLVWTVQTRLRRVIRDRQLPYAIFNDYPMLPGPRRALSADLVIRDADKLVLVAAEFKYEPSHERADFLALPRGKFPVVDWGMEGVAKDLARIRDFVEQGGASTSFAVLVDEGRHFRHRPAHVGSTWIDWAPTSPGHHAPAILWARWPPA